MAICGSTVDHLLADCRLFVGQQMADSRPTEVFLGAPLHNYPNVTSNKWSSLKFMLDVTLPKLLSHPKLIQFVNSINPGSVKDYCDFCNDLQDENQVYGSYRDLEEMLLELGAMYVSLDKKTPFPLNFGEPFWHFRVSLGADRGRIGSCNENFLCAVQTTVSLIHSCGSCLAVGISTGALDTASS